MKTTTKLRIIGAITGSIALVTLAAAIGYAAGTQGQPSVVYELINSAIVILGFASTGSFLSAVIVRVLQGDQVAAASLAEAGRQLGGGEPPGAGLRRIK